MHQVENSILTRYPGNPILTQADFPPAAHIKTVFKSGIIKMQGRYLMLCRVENAALVDRFWIAESKDGYQFTPHPAPVQLPHDNPEFAEYTAGMYYDPRITEIDGIFYIVHAAHSGHGCRLSLVKTLDFEKFEWLGFISETDNRNGVLFPEKINGLYARFDRPNTGGHFGDIWISYSPDLLFWGKSQCVLRNSQVHWAWAKIGPGAVPIKTDAGWLNIFHGVRTQCAQHYVYQLGVALHDLNDPAKILGLAADAILAPETPYELMGQTPGVVFTSGAILEADGEVKIYYGGADTVQCVALTTVDQLLNACYNRQTFPY
ncbi:glycoside hydrolase family 130 protein [candidate division KSB1 bacterium]|nr:glycoside hydrolase family 130 protein [candidate division KSB1 bacterium]